MQRVWQILAVVLVVVLMAPAARGLCVPQAPDAHGHACCAPEAQLQAPDCCKTLENTPQRLPSSSTTLVAVDSVPMVFAGVADRPRQHRYVSSLRTADYPILLPATILRT